MTARWTDLLGPFRDGTCVLGQCLIVPFDSWAEAEAALAAWKAESETEAHPIELHAWEDDGGRAH